MIIAQKKVVSIDYTLKDDSGKVIDTSEDGGLLVYLHGADNIIPGLEEALEGKSSGYELSVRIPPEEAYGVRDESMFREVPRDMFEENKLHIGAQFHAEGPEGEHIAVTITEIVDDNITVDGNHPLAGEHLNFEVKVVEIREATEEELEHGHVYGEGEYHH